MNRLVALAVVALAGCGASSEADHWEAMEIESRRGWPWQVAWLREDDQIAVYLTIAQQVRDTMHVLARAVGDTVQVPDQLLDPRLLPHKDGGTEPRMKPAVLNALLESEAVDGLCTLQDGTPDCQEGMPGLVLEFSRIYRARGNGIVVFVMYVGLSRPAWGPDRAGASEALQFDWAGEDRYCLERHRTGWRVTCKEGIWVT